MARGTTGAGPAGTGLIPPGSTPSRQLVDDPNPDRPTGTDDGGQGGQDGGNGQPVHQPDPAIIDGAPPVDVEDDGGEGGDGDGDEGFIDPEEFARQIEDRVQRRFDRAISRALRNAGLGGDRRDDPEDDGSDGGQGGKPPRQARTAVRRSPAVDVSSMRIVARDSVEDLLANAGSQEKRAVKQILDRVIPAIDWSAVDDEVEFVEDLVQTLSGRATELVKTGSDRKVAQLRRAGYLPELPGQPAGAPAGAPGARRSVSNQMQAGAARAASRWPSGKRRLGATR